MKVNVKINTSKKWFLLAGRQPGYRTGDACWLRSSSQIIVGEWEKYQLDHNVNVYL